MVGPISYCLEREPDFFALTRLQGAVVPQAQRLITEPNKPLSLTPVGAAPVGEYELIALGHVAVSASR